jgi:glycerol-3-phosphate O-acyltransferase
VSASVAIPVWLFLVLGLLALWSVLDRLLIPSVRWYLRRRVNLVINEVNERLSIQIQSFQLTKRQVLIDRLIYDPKVIEAVDERARETGVPRDVIISEVQGYAREIVPAFNAYIYFRAGYWIAKRFAQLLYRVRIGAVDRAAYDLIDKDAAIVFIMNHRSNMDYVLVAYLVAEQAAVSYAVGEWARIWPLQALIRAMGAYFVRRNSGDALYRRVLERYVWMATDAGVTQAAFPEGGLSRDGRLRPPRMGLIDYMARNFDPDGRDVVFVPVGINYDRTLEDRTLLLDRDSDPRRRTKADVARTVFGFILRNVGQMLRGRWFRFGYACVNFGAPLSLKSFARERAVDFRTLDRDDRTSHVEVLVSRLMNEVGRVVPVLPVALVTTVLLRHVGMGIDELALKGEAHALLGRLEGEGANVYIPRRDRDYAVQVGLRMLVLRHLAIEEDGLYRANEAELDALNYYANSIAHLLEDRGG